MASYQQFELGGVNIQYYKNENVILLKPGPKTSKDKFNLLKNKLETVLSVDSMKMEPGGGISLKLDQNSAANVSELLRSFNAMGGEEVDDAEGLSDESVEDDLKDKNEKSGKPPQQAQPPQTGMGGMGGAAPMQLAAWKVPEVYCMLYEGVFGSDTFLKPKKPGRRTGKYWKVIERVTGKNRAKMLPQDILRKRREASKKSQNDDRDKVLRALDKAFDYFYKREQEERGRGAAEKFAEDYYAIDNLNPKDYALNKGKPEPIGPEEPVEQDFGTMQSPQMGDELNGPDFSEMFQDDEDEDSYDDMEVEEEPFR